MVFSHHIKIPAFTTSSGKQVHRLAIHCVKNTFIFFLLLPTDNIIGYLLVVVLKNTKKKISLSTLSIPFSILQAFCHIFTQLSLFQANEFYNYLASVTSKEMVFVYSCNPCMSSAFSLSFWNRTEVAHSGFNLEKDMMCALFCSPFLCWSFLCHGICFIPLPLLGSELILSSKGPALTPRSLSEASSPHHFPTFKNQDCFVPMSIILLFSSYVKQTAYWTPSRRLWPEDQGKLLCSSALASSLGHSSLKVLRKGQGRGGLPRGRDNHEKGQGRGGQRGDIARAASTTWRAVAKVTKPRALQKWQMI